MRRLDSRLRGQGGALRRSGAARSRGELSRLPPDIAAAWSPDGSKIVFHDGEGTVWTTNRDGTDLRLLVVRGELEGA